MFNSKVSFVIGLNAYSRPYPESTAVKAVTEELAVHGIDGFSLTRGIGFWRGAQEDIITVSVLVTPDSVLPTYAERIAQVLAIRLNQECVLWSIDAADAGLSYAAHNDNFRATPVAAKAA